MDDKPRIRPIEAFPVQQDGKTLIYLKDPLNLATPIGISPVVIFCWRTSTAIILSSISKQPIIKGSVRC